MRGSCAHAILSYLVNLAFTHRWISVKNIPKAYLENQFLLKSYNGI